MLLPNADYAVVDLEKSTEYVLNPDHPTGRHKARVFEAVLGLMLEDEPFLQQTLREVVVTHEATEQSTTAHGQRYVDEQLKRGQVGTIIEEWQPGVYEVEFADTDGITYATVALKSSQLMTLCWHPTPSKQSA